MYDRTIVKLMPCCHLVSIYKPRYMHKRCFVVCMLLSKDSYSSVSDTQVLLILQGHRPVFIHQEQAGPLKQNDSYLYIVSYDSYLYIVSYSQL